MLSLQNIAVHRDGRTILKLNELEIASDQFTVILGQNGSGKSTLMNLMARQFPPDSGTITLDNQPLTTWSSQSFAQRVAYLPQHLLEVAGLTVYELIRLGRFPWRGLLGRWRDEDQAIITTALEQTHLTHYADHLVDTLSGGERQRAWIAMLLAQASPLILLDEPTSALDLAHQYDVIALLRKLNHQTGRGIVVILHDVNLSCRFADRIIAMRHGELFFDGPPERLLDSTLLSTLYGIKIELIAQPSYPHKIAVVA